MNKIPVGETIARAYGFAGRRAFNNLGLIWLAAAFYGFAVYYWLDKFSTTMLVSPHPGAALNDFAYFDLFCLVVVMALGSATMAVTLTRDALEPRREILTAFFMFGRRDWLMFSGLLFLYAIAIATVLGLIFAGGLLIAALFPQIGLHAEWHGISALSAMNGVVVFATVTAFVLLTIRFGFFLAATTVAEGAAWPTRVWALCRGNFWRLFVVVSVIALPVMALWAAADWFLVGEQFAAAVSTALAAGHDSTALYQAISDNADMVAVSWTVLLVLLNVLFAGASSFSYALVRDSVPAKRRTTVQRSIEPSFAGAFASAPRHALEPLVLQGANEHREADVLPAERGARVEGFSSFGREPEEHFAKVSPSVESQIVEKERPIVAEVEHREVTVADVAETWAQVRHAEDAVTNSTPTTGEIAEEASALDAPAPHEEAAASEAGQGHSSTATQFPLVAEPVDTLPIEAIMAYPATPQPSSFDATESSQQNVPSEAA